ncbi:uncharacterized protein [Heterodontus francisci]|uniref:uncharacterized protein n=1 Tax=Heterodontus francisci TaxID=7792 RepID=UPI00355C7EC1
MSPAAFPTVRLEVDGATARSFTCKSMVRRWAQETRAILWRGQTFIGTRRHSVKHHVRHSCKSFCIPNLKEHQPWYDKSTHNQCKWEKTSGGVPDIRVLTPVERRRQKHRGGRQSRHRWQGAYTRVIECCEAQDSTSGEEDANAPDSALSPASSSTSSSADTFSRSEKCREQQMHLYIAFIDLTKAFDLVSRRGLVRLLEKIGCPPKLLSITSFHDNMKGTIQHGGPSSDPFPILSGVKQGCVHAPTLFGIFFSLLLTHAFQSSEEGIFLHTRSGGSWSGLSSR